MLLFFYALLLLNCGGDDENQLKSPQRPDDFVFGVDLSYVNQIMDHGGVYKLNGQTKSAYEITKTKGANLVRLRLWHSPTWTKAVYGVEGTQMYNDLADVTKSIQLAKAEGMEVLLDFHYSDSWADPGKQEIPGAWEDIVNIETLKDSVYNYTFKILLHLESMQLLPEYVQIGNETNCGMLYTNASTNFPTCNVCDNKWQNMGSVINSAIAAVEDVRENSTTKTKIILHVADPKNVMWWFDGIMAANQGNVKNFDIIGFSYYPLWHRTIGLDQISNSVSTFKAKYNRDVMILETAYPWTTEAKDSYNNHFGSETPLTGFPFSQTGQYDFMVELTQEVMDGGGNGVIYWEPAWISSQMKDLWGTGSSWENNTFFDFEGNAHHGISFMTFDYN